jgi:hypothetical protein
MIRSCNLTETMGSDPAVSITQLNLLPWSHLRLRNLFQKFSFRIPQSHWNHGIRSHGLNETAESDACGLKETAESDPACWIRSCTVNPAPAQSHIWHMLCKICFTMILCWLHLRRIWHTMCQKNGEADLTHVCNILYASHVAYCLSLEATLSHCVSYLTLCRDRFTVVISL